MTLYGDEDVSNCGSDNGNRSNIQQCTISDKMRKTTLQKIAIE